MKWLHWKEAERWVLNTLVYVWIAIILSWCPKQLIPVWILSCVHWVEPDRWWILTSMVRIVAWFTVRYLSSDNVLVMLIVITIIYIPSNYRTGIVEYNFTIMTFWMMMTCSIIVLIIYYSPVELRIITLGVPVILGITPRIANAMFLTQSEPYLIRLMTMISSVCVRTLAFSPTVQLYDFAWAISIYTLLQWRSRPWTTLFEYSIIAGILLPSHPFILHKWIISFCVDQFHFLLTFKRNADIIHIHHLIPILSLVLLTTSKMIIVYARLAQAASAVLFVYSVCWLISHNFQNTLLDFL